MRAIRILVSTLLVLPLAIASAAQESSTTIRDNGHMRWTYSDGENRFDVQSEGEIVFGDDDRSILRVSDGGYITIRLTEGNRRVELDVRPGRNGAPVYDYSVNGRERAFDATAQREVGDLLLMVVRETGINAETRVARILRDSGPDGVFAEIEEIRSGSSVARYLTELVAQTNLDASRLNRAADVAVRRVSSSGSRARFLRTSAAAYMAVEETYEPYFGAVASIESSGDRTRTLMAVLEAEPNREAFAYLLDVASDISSSGDKTRLLMASLGRFPSDTAIREQYFRAVKTIPSSGDRSRLLQALLTEYEIDAGTASMAFDAAAGISSSGDKARVLTAAAPYYTDTDAEREAYFRAVSTISSSGDHARVLSALLDGRELSKATLLAVLHSIRGISSIGDAGRVLREAAPFVEDDDLVDAYLAAAESISSPGDRSRALAALIEQ